MSRVIFRQLAVLALLSNMPASVHGESPAPLIADGQPWTSTLPNGPRINIAFLPDGTARMTARIMNPKMTWQPTEEGFCLSGGPGGERRIRLEQTSNGLDGYEGDTKLMSLTR